VSDGLANISLCIPISTEQMWSEKHCCILKEDAKILSFYLEQPQKLFDFCAMMPRTGFYQYKMCSFSAIYSKLAHYLLHCPCKRFAVITELNEEDVSETKVFQIHLLAKLFSLICFRGIMWWISHFRYIFNDVLEVKRIGYSLNDTVCFFLFSSPNNFIH